MSLKLLISVAVLELVVPHTEESTQFLEINACNDDQNQIEER